MVASKYYCTNQRIRCISPLLGAFYPFCGVAGEPRTFRINISFEMYKCVDDLKKYTPALLTILLVSVNLVQAQLSEYEVKAVFLERFTRFIEWPEGSSVYDTTKPFVLGIIGKNPFDSKLEELYSTQKIKAKEVEILEIKDLNEIARCQLLFVAKSVKKDLPDILNLTRDKPILTISDTEGFAERGVFINLISDGKRIRYEINEAAVRDSNFTMSYRLLKNAKIVKPGSKS